MGVPKFYRWLSERYPCINENVNQYNMPEFDNFYVDMNGVFHICSHPSDDIHFRLSEAQIFENIAIYVEFLFNLVQPRKVFFLSVDGVAPRSKMNQQRSRRYKTAKEAIEKEEKAKKLGESLPDDPRFDSNCITPGTEFMDKLHQYMVDFLKNKAQNNQSWREVEVIYSGYDVPGEGEHKIMDYIRYSKTKNNFDKCVRHCLYGLDADLINLGLSCHEPYFSLLREEVVFTKNAKRHCDPFKTNFQLLHLSILRNYLDQEFRELEPKLSFKYDLERIIDDWILMNFLIGNDFLPHIPKFHVDKGSIQILYDTYKAVLPNLDGYLNHEGTIQLPRYRKYLQKLGEYDMELFTGNSTDLKYFCPDFNNETFDVDVNEPFDFGNQTLESENETSDEKDDETMEENSDEIDEEFTMHKNNYYRTKLHFENMEGDVLTFVNEYIKGVQWVLYYYFNGCVSWNWFYPYYYGPYVSDLCKFDIIDFNFQASTPFQPLMQLLAVIPQASKEILPYVFQSLTHNSDSPLIKYFPKEVVVDMNEKIHDYEAIILIPFIEEELLISVFKQYEHQLTSDEVHRNQFGVHYSLTHSDLPVKDQESDENYPNVKVIKYKQDDFILPPELIFKGVRKNVNPNEIIGFPTLSGIKFDVKLDMARLKVFRFASQNPSMLLQIRETSYNTEQLMDFAKKYIGQMVYINWPLLSEAKLIELIDGELKYVLNAKNQVSVEELSKYEIGYAKQMSNSHCSALKNKKGVVLDSVHVMAKVVPLQSQKYIVTAGKVILHKEWSKAESFIPLELVVFSEHPTSKIPIYKSLNTVFTKGKSFFLIDQPHYGYKADVVEYIKSQTLVKAKVCITSEPDFSDIKNNFDYILDENYVGENKLILKIKQKLGLADMSVRRLLGSVVVNYKDKSREKKMNIGLKLKYKSNMEMNIKPHCIPGYSMVDGNDLYYNYKVIDIFEQFHQKFRCVFDMISSQHKAVFELSDLYTNLEMDKSDKIKALCEIKDWIDSLELSKIGHVKSTATYLDNCIVETIEETIESHSVLMSEERQVEMCLPPSNFYISEFVLKGTSLPDPRVKFYLFDRVVNIKKCIAVPYGAKGTIIGIYNKDDELSTHRGDFTLEPKNDDPDYLEILLASVIEVMFDETFDGALKTRSTKPNTYKMQAAWLINVTYGLMTSKRPTQFNNYYAIQSFPKLPKTSTPNAKFNNNKAPKQASNGIPNPRMSANERPNKFNHSENSPFKILTKNTQTTSGNFIRSSAHAPPAQESKTESSHGVPHRAAPIPISLPMPALPGVPTPKPPPTNNLHETFKMLGLNVRTASSQSKPSTSGSQAAVAPKGDSNVKAPPMPSMEWIASAKNKSARPTTKTGPPKNREARAKNTNNNAIASNGNEQVRGAIPFPAFMSQPEQHPQPVALPSQSQPVPPPQAAAPPQTQDNTWHPAVSQLFHNAGYYNDQSHQRNNNQGYGRNQNYNRNNYQNHNNNKNANRSYPAPQGQANTSNNFQYNVPLHHQNTDIKQFIPLAVARNYQHERNVKLKQFK